MALLLLIYFFTLRTNLLEETLRKIYLWDTLSSSDYYVLLNQCWLQVLRKNENFTEAETQHREMGWVCGVTELLAHTSVHCRLLLQGGECFLPGWGLPFAQLEQGFQVLQTKVGRSWELVWHTEGCGPLAPPLRSCPGRCCVHTFPAHTFGRHWSVLDKLAFQAPYLPNTRPLCYF